MDVKSLWSDQDFQYMGWHDSRIYSLMLPDEDFRISLDIDYIFKWERSGEKQGFLVSPCNLEFINVSSFKVDIDYNDSMLIFISEIKRFNERLTPNGKLTHWDFEIECDCGSIYFSATGFEQKVRSQPILSKTQDLNKLRVG